MTLLSIKTSNTIVQMQSGIADSLNPTTTNLMNVGAINAAKEHIVNFLKSELASQNITGINIASAFPEYPRDGSDNLVALIKPPAIFVDVRLGATNSTADMYYAQTIEGEAHYFNQIAYLTFDCFGVNNLIADQLAGWVTLELEKGKKYDLAIKGFQNFDVVYSSPEHGADYRIFWDFGAFQYKQKIIRHLVQVRTAFDVIWVKPKASVGIITQIVFDSTDTYAIDDTLGVNMDYMFIEEIQFGWHPVLP